MSESITDPASCGEDLVHSLSRRSVANGGVMPLVNAHRGLIGEEVIALWQPNFSVGRGDIPCDAIVLHCHSPVSLSPARQQTIRMIED